MIPILYESTETEFASNGIGRLRDCVSCVVTEERNGVYECDFEYPIAGAHFGDIDYGRIIVTKHEDSDDLQPFEIIGSSEPIDGIVTFHCVHISYRQSKMTVSGTNINSLIDAFALLANALSSNPFSYESDKYSEGYLPCADGIPYSVKSMLGGMEGSILDTYGGEYEWDKWTVRLWDARGEDRDFTIRYGLNVTDYNEDIDFSETYTAVIPYWTGSGANNETITVRGDMVDSHFESYNGFDLCVPLDLSEKFEEQPTKAELEAMALDIMSREAPNLPDQTLTVDFIQLQKSEQYEMFADLFRCNLCDTIRVIYRGATRRFKVVKVEYDVLLERYQSMELGNVSTTLKEALGIR